MDHEHASWGLARSESSGRIEENSERSQTSREKCADITRRAGLGGSKRKRCLMLLARTTPGRCLAATRRHLQKIRRHLLNTISRDASPTRTNSVELRTVILVFWGRSEAVLTRDIMRNEVHIWASLARILPPRRWGCGHMIDSRPVSFPIAHSFTATRR